MPANPDAEDRVVESTVEKVHGSFRSIVFNGALGATAFTRVEGSGCLSVTTRDNHVLDEEQTRRLMDWLGREFD